MSLRIAHNVEALSVQRGLNASGDRLAVAMKRLATGLRINSAADDAAGLGISERMRGQIRGLEQANRNIQDGMSLLQTMEGALQEVHKILHRARDLTVQHNNFIDDTSAPYNAQLAIREELIALSNELARIEQQTTFNGIPILQDSTIAVTIQVGANDGEVITVSLVELFGPGVQQLTHPAYFFTLPWVEAGIQGMDDMIDSVSAARGRIGAAINRLEHVYNSNATYMENLTQAESRIRDVDMAAEMTRLTREQVLQRSGMTMLIFAQQSPARVLDLLANT